MFRSRFVLAAVLGFTFCSFAISGASFAQESTGSSNQTGLTETQLEQLQGLTFQEIQELLTEGFKRYEQQLQAVLKTRFNEEKDFVAQITLMVQEEQLPKKLVDSAWLWVRKNRPVSKYPFVYFERVLRLQAEKANFTIPDFDRKLYTESLSQRASRNAERQRRR